MPLFPYPRIDVGPRGHWVGLSLPRKFVCDLLYFAKKVPSVPTQRRMKLGRLVAARARLPQRPSWCAIFLKAFAIVAAERPELRRSYMPLLWPHLYEHPINVGNFSLERQYRGEPGVFFTQVPQPELLSLAELDAHVRRHKLVPIEEVPSYRRALLLSRLPLPLRRLVWWLGLFADGSYRAHFFGTFAVSVVASHGSAGLHILSPLTTTLNYGTFEPDGSIDVRIAYDHRVFDGAPAARAMTALEEALLGPILEELESAAPTLTAVPDLSAVVDLPIAASVS